MADSKKLVPIFEFEFSLLLRCQLKLEHVLKIHCQVVVLISIACSSGIDLDKYLVLGPLKKWTGLVRMQVTGVSKIYRMSTCHGSMKHVISFLGFISVPNFP